MLLSPAQRDRVVTPDGVPLAPWWRRLIAYWIDGFLLSVAVQALLLPLQALAPGSWFGSIPRTSLDTVFDTDLGSWRYVALSIAATLVLGAVYSILMVSRLGWTLGKRILGIRVRHRERERLATPSEAIARWAVQLAPAALSTAGPFGAVAGLWVTIDGLRPLIWNDRRQAFHDSAAGTSVVMA
ncbi:RDD family protein [Agrococcus jejuensis]|uniref:RDD family protein n=2 Tax=Agrococcus jejuensis TaxID=399736 RepID=A0A1G8DYU3_9MICO|nr:RDD family protein [Agrococcus jejuensis]